MVDKEEQRIVGLVSGNMPLVVRPYLVWAEQTGLSETQLIALLRRWKKNGVLRKVGLVLRHRQAGFTANALCLWVVPGERMEAVAAALAREKLVSHCYARETSPGWPYNLYWMLHGQSEAACREQAASLAAQWEIDDCQILFSTKEWKKTSPMLQQIR